MTERVAAIDCGTNSLRLLIAEPGGAGLVDVVRVMRIVRLGQGVDQTGMLHADALARTEVVLSEYAEMISASGASAVRMVATSAVRDAGNRAAFEAMVLRSLGRPAEVASGVEEARLSFTGACAALPAGIGTVLVVDIGGGSTELVSGTAGTVGTGGEVGTAVSLDVGSVRLTERYVRTDPISAAEREAVAAQVAGQFAGSGLGRSDAQLVGVAGTVTTVAALALGLSSYSSVAVEGARLSRARIDAAVDALMSMSRVQRLATGVIHPGRVDVIAAGALILQTLMAHLSAPDIVVTEHDILDGIAASLC